jgi:signal transduction histidine kinase
MWFFPLTAILNAITTFILSIFVYFKNRESSLNKSFALFSFSSAIWSFNYFLWQISTTTEAALFWSRALMAGAIFIPIFYFHFVILLTDFYKTKRNLLIFGYFLTFIFFILNFTPLFVKGVSPKLFFPFWPEPGIAFHFFLIMFFCFIVYSWYLLSKSRQKFFGVRREQVKYVLIGTLIGFLGASTNYLLWYNIPFPPYGNFSVLLGVGIIAYAIVKYRLMDIQIAFGRGVVYFLSFITVIALGFLLVFLNNQLIKPLPFYLAGPLIIIFSILIFQPTFKFFEKFVSRYFYYTFYSSQKVLTDLGKRLTEILDLDKLSSLIVETLVNIMKLDRAVILLREPKSGTFQIKKNIGFREENGISLLEDNFLTLYLEKTQKPLVWEELSLAIRDSKKEKEKADLEKLQSNMKRVEANVCLPLLIEGKLTGLILLGNKISGDPYSREDLQLLVDLSYQSSVALENARLYQIVQDLSRNLQEKVEEQTKTIKDLLEMKSEFLRVVSHQLNTPVSIIKGMLSMMVEGSVKGERLKEFIKKAYLSAERLYTILSDILTAQALIGGEEILNLSPCQIENIIEREVEHFKIQAQLKGLKINFKRPEELLPTILADSGMLERIISRLIDNAILYTPEGGQIELSLTSEKRGDKDFLVVSVKDSGIGLTKEEKEKLFNLFWRGERAVRTHPNGSGLGLFIVKKLVELHQGEVRVESEGEGKGSVFTITIPLLKGLD